MRVPREYHFADLNGEQLESARRFGISRPIKNRKEVRRKTRHLKKVRSCQLYLVDPLTHSVPYLTKGARSLLEDLGEGFQYILRREGYRPHRIIVTSLLRTEADVTRSAGSMATLHATPPTSTPPPSTSATRASIASTEGKPVSNAEMARILAILIDEFRSRGDCVVIFEQNQHCFHITVRR